MMLGVGVVISWTLVCIIAPHDGVSSHPTIPNSKQQYPKVTTRYPTTVLFKYPDNVPHWLKGWKFFSPNNTPGGTEHPTDTHDNWHTIIGTYTIPH